MQFVVLVLVCKSAIAEDERKKYIESKADVRDWKKCAWFDISALVSMAACHTDISSGLVELTKKS